MFKIKNIQTIETKPLRHKILRPHQPIEKTNYLMDDHPLTFNLGVFHKDKLIAIASFYPMNENEVEAKGIWRLRGMAVEEDFRRRGLGRQLVEAAVKTLKQQNQNYIWCNARVSALNFYKNLGFSIEGDEFNIEGIGPHYVMKLEI